jgi:enhancing lycopene biosynthesis protein 2
MTKVCVVLSGCGHLDGAEIRESVLTLLSLSKAGADVQLFAPDIAQHHVVNHRTGEPTAESRNVLEEAARIARGKVQPLAQARVEDFDAIILPGGYGVAKNLCDFAFKGAGAAVLPELQALLRGFVAAHKPIGAICIAPALVAAALEASPTLTIGSDAGTAAVLESMGAVHQTCDAGHAVVDSAHRIVSTPAYMCDAPLHVIAEGIETLVQNILTLVGERHSREAA